MTTDQLIVLADNLIIGKQYTEAKKCYIEILRRGRESARTYAKLGFITMCEEDYPAAQYYYQKAIEIQPEFAGLYYNLSIVVKKVARKISLLRHTIALDPNFAHAYVNLATILAKSGETEEAAALLRKALELEPDDFKAHLALTDVLCRVLKIPEARHHAEIAVRLQPGNTECLMELSRVCGEEGNETERIKILKQVLAIEPGNGEAYSCLGHLALMQGNYNSSIKYLEKAIAAGPDIAYNYFEISVAYRAINDPRRFAFFYHGVSLAIEENDLELLAKSIEYSLNLDAPMLTCNILNRTSIRDTDYLFSFIDPIQDCIRQCRYFRLLIDSWEGSKADTFERLQSTALINFYLGDYVEAYRIFNEEMDNDRVNKYGVPCRHRKYRVGNH